MTGRTFDGRPLTSGVNVDALDIEAGVAKATELKYIVNGNDRMAVTYALQRHARGEEDGAEKTWLGHFGPSNFTGWRMVLAAAMAGAAPKPPEPAVVFVVFDDGGYEEGEVIAASSNKAIAESIATLGYNWTAVEIPLVEDLSEVESVTVYSSSAARMPVGLWSINHNSNTTWRRRVECGEADLRVLPGSAHSNPVVTVTGTNAELVRATLQAEALKIEAEYGHDKLRTQVEELDPIERF